MSRFLKKALSHAALLAMFSSVLAIGASASIAPKIVNSAITATANAAFTDLTACLTSGKAKALDVFYLVDNSRSLRNTDPQEVRFSVIENSIAQLGDFAASGVSVSYAVGTFSTGARSVIPWTAIQDSEQASAEGNRASERLRDQPLLGTTDWEAGLRFAYSELQQSDNCRAIIWFTDGAINPDPNQSDPPKFASLDNLCHSSVSEGDLSATGEYGLLAKFKQEQITVFAVLLEDPSADASDRYFASYLQALVEGSGDLVPYSATSQGPTSGKLVCAELGADGKALPGESNGALLLAEDPVALAYQFLKLESQLLGGSTSLISENGDFTIGAGTVRFRIAALDRPWSLTGPEGSNFSVDSTNANLVKVQRSSGVLSIDVPITSAEQLGTWTFESDSASRDLIVYSGLTLELDRDRDSQIVRGRDNSLTGKVAREPGINAPVDLSVYKDQTLTLEIIDNGQLIPVQGTVTQVDNDGQFRVEGFQPPEGLGDELTLRLTLDIGEPFQPIRAEFTLNVIDASAFPSVANAVVKLSNLVGPEGAATGVLVVSGPASGEPGTFCIASEAQRTDDPAKVGPESIDRLSQFSWSFTGPGLQDGGSNTCFLIPAGETVEIGVSVTNPVQANSRVISIREVVSSTDPSTLFSETVTFEFESETQQNDLITILAIIALLLLGLLLPLALLYLFNKIATKFNWSSEVVRADFDVVVSDGFPRMQMVDGIGQVVGPIAVAPETFKGTTPLGKVARADLGAFGQLRAVVPLFPLKSSWFEWEAPKGSRVVSMPESSFTSGKRFQDGYRAEVSGEVSQIWGLVVQDSEIGGRANGPWKATLVVFAKRNQMYSYTTRIADLINKSSNIDALRSLATLVPPSADTGAPGPVLGGSDGTTLPPPPQFPTLPPPPPAN